MPDQISRRKLIGAIGTIGVTSAGAGVGTFAYFQDTEQSSGNTVSAGSFDLGATNGGSMEWSISNATPGGLLSSDDQNINFYNSGTVGADHLELDFSHTTHEDNDGDKTNGTNYGPESDPVDGAAGMSGYIKVVNFNYQDTEGNTELAFVQSDGTPVSDPTGGTGSHPQLTDTNNNEFIDLEDLAHSDNQDALDNITPAPPTGGSENAPSTQTTLDIGLEVDSSLPNDYQGDILETTVTFRLEQDSSQ